MKKILFFSRCELVHLYGPITKHLENNFEVVHIAYSDEEKSKLQQLYGVSNIIHFENEIRLIYEDHKFSIEQIETIDKIIIENSDGRFCLNSAIQSDRTFQYIPYEESLKLVQIYYQFWDRFLQDNEIDFIIHEPNALFSSQIASIIGKKYNTLYFAQIQIVGKDKYNWIFVEGDNSFPFEFNTHLKKSSFLNIDKEMIKNFLEVYRSKKEGFLSEITSTKKLNSKTRFFLFVLENFRIFGRHLKRTLFANKVKDNNYLAHVDLFHQKTRRTFREDISEEWDYFFNLNYDSFESEREFYFYPIHLEPEAVVLYWGDGLYKNQVKLIENIAAQLPANCYLYVKDHPHGGKYRDYSDYRTIKNIPNVKLLDPNIPGKIIISKSKGVITINGTAGFEALLLNKHVFTFGNSFYNLCKRVVHVKNIRDFRKLVYDMQVISYEDDEELYRYLNYYLKSVHSGRTGNFGKFTHKLNLDMEENSKTVAKGVISGINNIVQ